MKLLGAVLIVLGAGAGGVMMAQTLRERVKNLEQFLRGFQMMAVEIGYGFSPLETAFRRIAPALDRGVGRFFLFAAEQLRKTGSAESAWCEAIAASKGHLALTENDWNGLLSIGPLLGATDLEHQIQVLREAADRLRLQEEEARQRALLNERVFQYAGFAFGTMLALILY